MRAFFRTVRPAEWSVARLGALVVAAGGMTALLGAEPATNSPLAVWDALTRVTLGGGYRDNVLRTSVAPEGSSFVTAAGDFSLMRLSESGSQWTFFVLGEDTRYFDVEAVDREQLFAGTVLLDQPVGRRDQVGGSFQYLYQFAILDVSETEADLRRVLVDMHGLTLRPYWKHSLGGPWAVKLEGTADRQLYRGDLDDLFDGAGSLSLVHTRGRQSEVALSYEATHRSYDTREQYDATGFPVAGTDLVYWRHEARAEWRRYWDQARHWRTIARAGILFNRDNGSGYFDYDRIQFSPQVRWSDRKWEFKLQARMGWYFYRLQQIAAEDRQRSYFTLGLRLERRLGKHWLVYAEAEREWNRSNDPLDDYRDWMAAAGVGAEF